MPRSYRHISEYEEEIIRLKGEGLTGREISERLGFSLKCGMPYSRSPYGSVETRDALRSKKKREKMQIAAERQVASPEKQLQQSVQPLSGRVKTL